MPSRWQLRVNNLPILEGRVKDCFTELSSNVSLFLYHTYFVKRKQQSFFRKCTQDRSADRFRWELCCERTRWNSVSPLVKQTDHSCYWCSLVSEWRHCWEKILCLGDGLSWTWLFMFSWISYWKTFVLRPHSHTTQCISFQMRLQAKWSRIILIQLC